MIGYLASSLANDSDNWVFLGPMIIFILFVISLVCLIIWLALKLVKPVLLNRPSTNNKTLKVLEPYIFISFGIAFVIGNAEGSKYDNRSILVDSLLLFAPFVLAAVISSNKLDRRNNLLLLAGVVAFSLMFLSNHFRPG